MKLLLVVLVLLLMKNISLLGLPITSQLKNIFFLLTLKEIKPKLFQKRKNDVRYSIDSWQGYFYVPKVIC